MEWLCDNQDTWWIIAIGYVLNMAVEYWLGRTSKVKAGSILELVTNGLKKKPSTQGVDMLNVVIAQGVELKYEGGKLILTAEVAQLILPKIEELKAKINDGSIDPIKGTDADKMMLLLLLEFIKGQITK